MSAGKDPAYPAQIVSGGTDNIGMKNGVWHYPGMTLRDYFAAKAMPFAYQSYVEHANNYGWDDGWRAGVAADAYQMADAMLAERSKGAA